VTMLKQISPNGRPRRAQNLRAANIQARCTIQACYPIKAEEPVALAEVSARRVTALNVLFSACTSVLGTHRRGPARCRGRP